MSKKKDKKARKSRANSATAPGATTASPGLFSNLGTWLRKHPSEQFLYGALLGAAAAYVLSNEELRGKILKGGIGLYGKIAGNFAELREQMADIKAELEAEKILGSD
ncbi:MAG: hypothetical protein LBG78_01385 [Azoarcus sp.]|jgi:hypothetical protein|nr:hypothetical protein [Azoarcus sp.]